MARAKFWGKKGFEFLENWAVVFFIVILIFSFLLSVVVVSPWVNYGIVAFIGIVLGYFIYSAKYDNKFPYYCLAFALIAGYNLGLRSGSRILLPIVFIAAILVTVKVKQLTE